MDLYQAFQQQGGDLSQFFSDGVHPNDAGYEVIANRFFRPSPTALLGDGLARVVLFGFTAAFGPGGD